MGVLAGWIILKISLASVDITIESNLNNPGMLS